MSLNNDLLETFITIVLPFAMISMQKGIAENFDFLQLISYFLLEGSLTVAP